MLRVRTDVLLRALVAFGLAGAILVAAFASAAHAGQGRPAGCPRAWCGCWGRLQVGLPPKYNLALAWLDLPRTSKQISAWAVMRRKGGGHVGRVVALDASGNSVILSGNHGGRVGTATYPAGRIVAYVRP